MSGWQTRDPSEVGLDPSGYADGQVPVYDDATGQFVPGEGGAGGDGKCGTDVIADTESTVDVAHEGAGLVPQSVVVTPRALDTLAVTARDGTTFTVARAGTSGDLSFDWQACGYEPLFAVEVFDTVGEFTWNWGSAGEPSEVEVLVVAGGGAGGRAGNGATGGGGAGGVLHDTAFAVSGNVAVKVGAGGTGPADPSDDRFAQDGAGGGDSEFGSLVAVGGGGGGAFQISGTASNGRAGGSGGGGAGGSNTEGSGSGGAGTSGQGNAGGTGFAAFANTSRRGGGGGGADEVGASTDPRDGGDGLHFSQFAAYGDDGWFGGGGGGSTGNGGPSSGRGSGGQGGGGAGGYGSNTTTGSGQSGAANTGGGGGGTTASGTRASGGSGIVIIRYPI